MSAIRTGHIDILSSDMRAHDILAFVFQLAQDLGLEKSSIACHEIQQLLKLKTEDKSRKI